MIGRWNSWESFVDLLVVDSLDYIIWKKKRYFTSVA